MVLLCGVLAPLAFVAAVASMLLPFAMLHLGDETPVELTGLRLIYVAATSLTADHTDMVQALLNLWRPTIIASGVFALAGVVAVLIRCFGRRDHRNLFEKIELGIGALGAICMGVLVSDAAETDLFKQGHLTYLYGLWSVAACYLIALAAAATAFFIEFPRDGEYRIGSLKYDNHTLARVFFWILWGDFFFTFFANVLPTILPLQLRAMGCSPSAMSILTGTIPNIIIMTVTPVISFKSDRTRSRWGRRIPYMLVTTPFVVLFLIPLGFTKQIAAWSSAHAGWLAAHGLTPAGSALVIVGVLLVGFTFFSDFANSVYWYLFADVVPEETMGRFMGLFRLVGAFAGFLFNTFVFKHAETHTELIYIVAGATYLIGFTLMCFKVKEGEYPTVGDDSRKPTVFGQAGIYFRECFTDPVAVAFFIFNMVWAVSNACAMFKIFFYRETAGISLAEIGRVSGWTGLIALLVMYPTGMIVDYFKPLPTLLLTTILLIPATFLGYYIHDYTTYVVISLIGLPLNMVWDATTYPAMVQVLPKDRFGQFCSANSLTRSLVRIFLALVGAWFIAVTSQDVVKIVPGATIRVWRANNQWHNEAVDTAGRGPLAMLQAAPAAPDFQPSTNLVISLALKGRIDLPDDDKCYFLFDPHGQDREIVMPGVPGNGSKRWFYITNTAHHGEILTVRQPQWQYMWIWQCVFMTVGLGSIIVLYVIWRRRERRGSGVPVSAETHSE